MALEIRLSVPLSWGINDVLSWRRQKRSWMIFKLIHVYHRRVYHSEIEMAIMKFWPYLPPEARPAKRCLWRIWKMIADRRIIAKTLPSRQHRQAWTFRKKWCLWSVIAVAPITMAWHADNRMPSYKSAEWRQLHQRRRLDGKYPSSRWPHRRLWQHLVSRRILSMLVMFVNMANANTYSTSFDVTEPRDAGRSDIVITFSKSLRR